MAKTVVGLFDSLQDAQNVAGEVGDVRGTDVSLVSQDVYAGSDSDILSMVTGAGVPNSDAQLYVQGVRQGATLVVAQTDDDRVNEVVDIMNRHNIVDIESRRSMYSAGGTVSADADVTRASISTSDIDTSYTTGTTGYTDTTRTSNIDTTRASTVDTGESIAVPIVEEELRVGKRQVETGGVRVDTHVEEVPVEEQVTLRDETVRVERRPVNQPASTTDLDAFQEGVIEVRETDEQAVVDKQARVVEEVVISKEAQERTETVRDTVRRTDVDVEQVPGQTRTSGTVETGRVSASDVSSTTSADYTTGTTGTTGSGGRSLTDRIEGATGLDIDRDGDAGGSTRRR